MLKQTLLLLGGAALFGIGSCQSKVDGCDAGCKEAFERALAAESRDWATVDVTKDPFYDTPGNFSASSKPGDLLRWQDLSSQQVASNFSQVPMGMSFSRFVYVSEDKDRKPIPASAFVLLPYSVPQGQTKLRTIVWAHGTAGNARKCAPSNSKRGYYGWQAPFLYASQGYAVIAPDYAGLGSAIPTTFQYEAGYLHAADVAYAVVAARANAAIASLLTDEWAVAGHSEGGMTAWRTNERLAMTGQEQLLRAGKFLGAASIAPALRPIELMPKEVERAAGGPIAVVSLYLLQALSGLYPGQIKQADFMTDTGLSLMPYIDQGCIATGSAVVGRFNVSQIYKNTTWMTGPVMQKWQKEINGAGPHKLAAPMLVVQGEADALTYPENAEADFDRTCSAFPASTAEYYKVPGAGHGTSLEAGALYYIPWIDALFEGKVPQQGCKKVTARPVTSRFVKDREGPLGAV